VTSSAGPIPDTAARILDAAMSALAHHGSRKLSMVDIGEAAGVSRGTLYRYFKNKDQVLEAIGRQVHDGVRESLARGIQIRPAPGDRVRVIIEVLVEAHRRFPTAEHMIEREPAFSLAFVRESYPEFVDIVTAALDPVINEIPIARAGAISARQLAKLLLRIVTTTFFVPGSDIDQIPQWTVLLAGLPVNKSLS
jgi:AcrR family transcriptional regulator